MDLQEKKFNTDKPQINLDLYARYFKDLKDKDVKLFELGVLKGGSLDLWVNFFKNVKVVGLDIEHVDVDESSGKIKFYQADQSDIAKLKEIHQTEAAEGFDIIIDDASHFGKETFLSFIYLFKNALKPGGIYVIEDWGTGYWPHYPDGRMLQLDEHNLSYHLHNNTDYKFKKKGFMKKGKYLSSRKFHSHDFGMVGVIKQLIDEVAISDATNPNLTASPKQTEPMIDQVIVAKGIVFVYKTPEVK